MVLLLVFIVVQIRSLPTTALCSKRQPLQRPSGRHVVCVYIVFHSIVDIPGDKPPLPVSKPLSQVSKPLSQVPAPPPPPPPASNPSKGNLNMSMIQETYKKAKGSTQAKKRQQSTLKRSRRSRSRSSSYSYSYSYSDSYSDSRSDKEEEKESHNDRANKGVTKRLSKNEKKKQKKGALVIPDSIALEGNKKNRLKRFQSNETPAPSSHPTEAPPAPSGPLVGTMMTMEKDYFRLTSVGVSWAFHR